MLFLHILLTSNILKIHFRSEFVPCRDILQAYSGYLNPNSFSNFIYSVMQDHQTQ